MGAFLTTFVFGSLFCFVFTWVIHYYKSRNVEPFNGHLIRLRKLHNPTFTINKHPIYMSSKSNSNVM